MIRMVAWCVLLYRAQVGVQERRNVLEPFCVVCRNKFSGIFHTMEKEHTEGCLMTFEELYRKVLKKQVRGEKLEENESRKKLDCLFQPEKYPLIWKNEPCDCEDARCVIACLFEALEVHEGKVLMNGEKCTGCAQCMEACQNKNLTFSRDAVKVVEMLKKEDKPVYAFMAPAFIGQFGEEATPGRIRSALKSMGFAGMIEVAAFADILTLKESLEFCENVEKKEGFQLTSCCCPVWISMIRRDFKKIAGHLPPAVSPMIACGRIAKALHKGCNTVFVGPCLAKKAEIREQDLAGDVDCVLTFQELKEIFDAFEIDFSQIEPDESEHSAAAGRMYARTGGVSQAVKESLEKIHGEYELRPVCACGVKECKNLLQKILDGEAEGNFFEGMACPGGCVGGPKSNIELEKATKLVNQYADQARYRTPGENPYVLDLIERLGFYTVEDFLECSDILTRDFSDGGLEIK